MLLNMNGALGIARDLWLAEGLPAEFLRHLKFHGNPDTAINSSFRIGAMAQVNASVLMIHVCQQKRLAQRQFSGSASTRMRVL
jgi:hypothetical protein